MNSTKLLYSYYTRSLKAENARLSAVVQTKFEDIKIPPGSSLVYQEIVVSRVCKTATVTRLFSSDTDPASLCESIFLPLKSEGWKSYDGCRVLTYPFKRAPIDGNRPSYSFARFGAGAPSTMFGVDMSAQPKEAWGPLFVLSTKGEQDAIPLAKKAGKTFFTVKLHYTEDHSLFAQHCPESSSRCDCVNSSLFAWKFMNGREYSRSD